MRMQPSCLSIMTETTINTIVTVISIGSTLASGWFAYRAKKIKEAVFKKLDTIDLIPFVDAFDKDYRKLTNKVRSKNLQGDSEEGKKCVAAANDLVLSLNKITPLLDDQAQISIGSWKSKAIEQIEKLNRNAVPDINTILASLDSIDGTLLACADKMKKS